MHVLCSLYVNRSFHAQTEETRIWATLDLSVCFNLWRPKRSRGNSLYIDFGSKRFPALKI